MSCYSADAWVREVARAYVLSHLGESFLVLGGSWVKRAVACRMSLLWARDIEVEVEVEVGTETVVEAALLSLDFSGWALTWEPEGGRA